MKYKLLIYSKDYGVIERIVEYDTLYALQSNIVNMGTSGIMLDSTNYKFTSSWDALGIITIEEGEYLYIPAHNIQKIEVKSINISSWSLPKP